MNCIFLSKSAQVSACAHTHIALTYIGEFSDTTLTGAVSVVGYNAISIKRNRATPDLGVSWGFPTKVRYPVVAFTSCATLLKLIHVGRRVLTNKRGFSQPKICLDFQVTAYPTVQKCQGRRFHSI